MRFVLLVIAVALTATNRSKNHHHAFAFSSSFSLSRVRSDPPRIFTVRLYATPRGKLSPLPVGISPLEKGLSKSLEIQGDIRNRAVQAVRQAIADGYRCLEIEFPPLLGGQRSASQFDDFDNIQELDQNRDWCVQFAPLLRQQVQNSMIWLIFPDDKECKLAKEVWSGKRYQDAAKFTTIEAAAKSLYALNKNSNGEQRNDDDSYYSKPWGATFASAMSNLMGNNTDEENEGLLMSTASSSSSSTTTMVVHLVCQPGNGGPVEDWINTKILHSSRSDSLTTITTTIVVNGALDKVRNGYYPPLVFPKLAKTIPFYKDFTSAFYLKPIYDQGLYGWLFRQYPEPWQVILQIKLPTITTGRGSSGGGRLVEERVALISEQRPTYPDIVQALLQASKASSSK